MEVSGISRMGLLHPGLSGHKLLTSNMLLLDLGVFSGFVFADQKLLRSDKFRVEVGESLQMRGGLGFRQDDRRVDDGDPAS